MDALVQRIWGVKAQREFMPCLISFEHIEAISDINRELVEAKLDTYGKVGKQTGKPTPVFKSEAEATEIEFI